MRELLKQLFVKYNIEFDEEKLNQLETFYQMVIEKNQVMNLTNITDEKDFAIKNILDSVLPINTIKENSTLVDVGAGAGFPSIPLKILRPDIKITMIDSLNKRVEFLKSVIQKLDLKNIQVIHTRAEDFAKLKREQFDVCVARAVAKLNTLLEYCLPLVKVNGIMIAYKSLKADEELNEAKNALNILGGKVMNLQSVFVKEMDSIRVNIIIKKDKNTPLMYPRNKNLAKSKPLI